MITAGHLAQAWDSFLADMIAALLTWGVLLLAWVAQAALLVMYGVGWERRRRARAIVLAATEDAVARTVPLPTQRGAGES